MEAGGEMGVSNTGKKQREERERKKRRLFRAAQFLRPWKRMEDIENRFELTAIQKSGFEGIQSFFWGGGGGKEKEKKGRKGGSRRENPSSNRKFVSRFVSRREFDACRIMKRGWSGIGVEKRLKVGSRNN